MKTWVYSIILLAICSSITVARHHYVVPECSHQCGNIIDCCYHHGYNDWGYCHQGNAVCTNYKRKDTPRKRERRSECDGKCSTIVHCCENELGYNMGGHCIDDKAFCEKRKCSRRRFFC